MQIGARIEEIREILKGSGKERGILRMEDRKGKMEVMEKKVILRDKRVTTEDD